MLEIRPELVPDQLPFDKLKRIAPRLLALESYSALPDDTHERDRDAVDEVYVSALGACDRRSELSDPLDTHVRRVIDEAWRAAEDKPDADHAVRPVLVDFGARGNAISCDKCAENAGTGRRCGVSGADYHRNIKHGGECVSVLKREFADAREAVRALVTRSLLAPPAAPELHLAIRNIDGAPHDLNTPYMVTGHHRVTDREDLPSGEVALIFHVEKLDMLTYRAVTYVLFHELVCHAWDGVGVLPRKRKGDDNEDKEAFADGWMDYVACQAVTNWLREAWGDAPASAERPEARLERGEIASAFHRARVERIKGRVVGAHNQRAAGADCARRFLVLLSREFPTQAIDLLLGWSLYLSIYRPARRERFLWWKSTNPHTDRLLQLISQRRYGEAWQLAEVSLR